MAEVNISEQKHDTRIERRRSSSDIDIDRAKGSRPSHCGTRLGSGHASPPTTVKEHEIEPCAIPQSGLLQVDLVSNNRSRRSVDSRK
jgi:hypothetical protein